MYADIRTKTVVDVDDIYLTDTVPKNAGDGVTTPPETIASFRTKTGKAVFLRALGNAVQSGGEPFVTFRLYVNGARFHPYDGTQNQWGDPSKLEDLPRRLPLPQGALVEVKCDNSDAANAYSATARIYVEYEDF